MQALQNTLDCEPRPLLLNQRMEELDLYGAVDACLCCLDSVNYVTEPEALQTAFERVHTFLNLDGLFVFDINTPRNSPALTAKAMSARTTAYSAYGRRRSRTACAPTSSIFSSRRTMCGTVRRKRTRSASTSLHS